MKKKENKKQNRKWFGLIVKDLKNETKFSISEMIVVILISVLFGVIIGYFITSNSIGFRGVKTDKYLKEIVTTYNNINSNYYKDVSKKKIADAAIEGMINSLDDAASTYLDSELTSNFNESIDGSFVGIGVSIVKDGDYNKIVKVNKNGPADKAGIKKGDYIINVNGKDCTDLSGNQLSSLIRGKKGTAVSIKIKRGKQKLSFKVVRDNVELDRVSSKLIDEDGHKIGYIKIDVFSSNTYKQFNKQLGKLEDKNIESLIIDVRNNPGGYLVQSKKILSLFFDKKTVLYRIKTSKKIKKIYSTSDETRSYPVVILTNESSASASEVLVSCFKENYNSTYIVGNRTYGKGTVQKSQSLLSGSSIKYTIERWLTSKGRDINEKGIDVDYEVNLDEEYYYSPTFKNDNQYQKALEILKKSQ